VNERERAEGRRGSRRRGNPQRNQGGIVTNISSDRDRSEEPTSITIPAAGWYEVSAPLTTPPVSVSGAAREATEAQVQAANVAWDEDWAIGKAIADAVVAAGPVDAELAAVVAERDDLREGYTSGPAVDPHGYSGDGWSGHQRAGIITRADAPTEATQTGGE
jgi:hypothetical protein